MISPELTAGGAAFPFGIRQSGQSPGYFRASHVQNAVLGIAKTQLSLTRLQRSCSSFAGITTVTTKLL